MNSPSAIPETTTSPCLFACARKIWSWMFFLTIPPNVLAVSTVTFEKSRLSSVPGSIVGEVREHQEEGTKSSESVSFLYEKPTPLLLTEIVSELVVIFATSTSSSHCQSPGFLAHCWNGRYRCITLMYLLYSLGHIQSHIGVLCVLCICMAYLEMTASRLIPVIFLICRAHVLLGQWDVMASSPRVKIKSLLTSSHSTFPFSSHYF